MNHCRVARVDYAGKKLEGRIEVSRLCRQAPESLIATFGLYRSLRQQNRCC